MMTAKKDSHLLLINPIHDWYTCLQEWRSAMHIVKLLERRFPKQKGRVLPILLFLSVSLLLLGVGVMFIQ